MLTVHAGTRTIIGRSKLEVLVDLHTRYLPSLFCPLYYCKMNWLYPQVVRLQNVGEVATCGMGRFISLPNEVGKIVVIARPTSKRTFSSVTSTNHPHARPKQKKVATPRVYSVFVTKSTTFDRHRLFCQKTAGPVARGRKDTPLAANF